MAYAETTKLPNEWPTTTYRSPGTTFARTADSSAMTWSNVLGQDGASLQARPARSVGTDARELRNGWLDDSPTERRGGDAGLEQHDRAAVT